MQQFFFFFREKIAQISNYVSIGDLNAKYEIFSEFSCGKTLIITSKHANSFLSIYGQLHLFCLIFEAKATSHQLITSI